MGKQKIRLFSAWKGGEREKIYRLFKKLQEQYCKIKRRNAAAEGNRTVFGYIKPLKAELKVKEWEVYQGIYCGLCKQLASRYGLFARMTLNYEFVFLAVLDMALREERIQFCQQNCMAHPFRKRTCCMGNQSLELCCDVAMLLTCYKLEDDLHDEGLAKRMAVRLVLPFARRDRKKAAACQPELAERIAQLMKRQQELEDRHCASVDEAAEPTALLMEAVLGALSDDSMKKRTLQRLGYLLGRWVYLVDALDDWDEDVQKGRYNPFAEQTGQEPEECRQQRYQDARGTLYLTIAEMRKTYDLLGIRSLDTILENVLDLGLRHSVDQIMNKRLNEQQRT